MVRRVTHQVEAKCRDVAPHAYRDPVKEASYVRQCKGAEECVLQGQPAPAAALSPQSQQ